MRWPNSRIVHLIIALTLGLLAAASVFGVFAMNFFNNYYFGSHKAYPYPYADASTAQFVVASSCALAFGIVFLAAFALQCLVTRHRAN